jgi:tripartite-type tricarboxylate transporter receptor subunit TctC
LALITGVQLFLFSFSGSYAQTSDPASFFKARTVSIIVGTAPGGPYDIYARTLSRHLGSHIPGTPNVVVQNMPGAGGLQAANYLYSSAPADGLTLGMLISAVPFAPVLGTATARFDARRFHWLGSMNKEGSVCVTWHSSRAKTFEDIQHHEVLVGNTGQGSAMELYPLMLNKVLGTKLKVVSGYRNGTDVYLAMERGEVEGRCGVDFSGLRSTRPSWLERNTFRVLVQTSLEPSDDPYVKDAPFALDLAKSEFDRDFMKILFARDILDKPFLMPPNTPIEKVKIMRRAFEEALESQALRADLAASQLRLVPVSGAQVKQIIEDAYNASPEVAKAAADAVQTSR